MIGFFVSKGLVNAVFAISLLGWRHAGFSIESGTRIYDERARESLCQYIVHAPVRSILFAEPGYLEGSALLENQGTGKLVWLFDSAERSR